MNPFTITIQIPETSVLALGELITAANKHGCAIIELTPGHNAGHNPVLTAIAKGVNQVVDDVTKLKSEMSALETLVLDGFTAPKTQPIVLTPTVVPTATTNNPPVIVTKAVTESSSVTVNKSTNKIKILNVDKISKPLAVLSKNKLPTSEVPSAIRWNGDLWVNRKQFATKLGISKKTFDRRSKTVPYVQYGVIFDDVPVRFYSVSHYMPAAENPQQDIIFDSKHVIDCEPKPAGPEELKLAQPVAKPAVKKAIKIELPTNNSSVREVMDFVQRHGGTTQKSGRCVILKYKNKTQMIAEQADHIPHHVLNLCRSMADA